MRGRLCDAVGTRSVQWTLARDFANEIPLTDIESYKLVEILSCGRERVEKMKIGFSSGEKTVIVKTFPAQKGIKRFFAKRTGTKAQRAFRGAEVLRTHGVGTPRVLALAEEVLPAGRIGESRLITEFVPELTDFRTELNRLLAGDGVNDPATEISNLMQIVAKACRAFHDCGIVHRDLGNQNIGLKKNNSGDGWEVLFLDLDRIRIFPAGSLTWTQRGRDLARLFLPSELRWFFSHMYCGKHPCPDAFNRGLHAGLRAWKFHCKTRILRHPIVEFSRQFLNRGSRKESANEGIGIWIWDEKTGQAVIAHDKKESRKFRPISNLFRSLKGFLSYGNTMRETYRFVNENSFSVPTNFAGTFGMTLDVVSATWEEQLFWLNELEVSAEARLPILLRFYHHKGREHWALVAEKAAELHTRGNPVAFALVQSRAAIRNVASWREMVLFAIEKTQAFADFYEIGHATNRSKWGVWDFRDYEKLIAPAIEAKKTFPKIKLVGPACIDFDLHNLPGILSVVPAGTFHALSQHLYVDRRGAPENFQGSFDLVGKCAVHRAFAKAYGFAEEKIIVSEVNWPLSGMETYSPCAAFFCEPGAPTSFPPNVSEDDYAKFMCRYWLLAIASGHVSRIYWWKLVHRGFGLIDDSDAENWRPMPAFYALKTLLGKLAKSRFERRLYDVPKGSFTLEFSRVDNSRFLVSWTSESFPEYLNL